MAARRDSLAGHLLAGGVLSIGIVVVNFVTGVLVTRTLGADGRGETSFLLAFVQTVGWLGALGINEGVTYLAARDEDKAKSYASTAALMSLALGTVGLVIAELLLPVLAGSQPSTTVDLGRVFALSIYLNVASALLLAVLSGCQDFRGRNVVQFLQPASYMVIMVVTALTDSLDVTMVLVATAASTVIAVAVAATRIYRTIGFARPSWPIAKESTAYGLRVQGSLIGSLVSGRLATVVMPTVLTYSAIGLYSVASNIAGILLSVVAVLSNIVLPAAVRRGGKEGGVLVARITRITLLLSVIVATPMFVFAPWALALVYGQEFRAAGLPLRILLGAIVLNLVSGVMEMGLQAANRPLAASIAQLVGLLVTVVGLITTLEPWGLVGASGTAVAAAVATFVTALLLLRRDPHFDAAAAFSPRGLARDVVEAWYRLRGALERTG